MESIPQIANLKWQKRILLGVMLLIAGIAGVPGNLYGLTHDGNRTLGFHQYFWNTDGEFRNEAGEDFKLPGTRAHAQRMQEAAAIYE
jgi:hypothetical protein